MIEVAGEDLERGSTDSDGTIEVTYRLAATDVHGKVRASDAQDVTLRLSAERRRQLRRHQLRIFSHLDLPPGSFRVRASVVNATVHGVVAGDVDVPDYRKATLIVSEPLVVSRDTATSPVRREDYELFEGRLSAAPTAQREFGSDDSPEVYVEVQMPVHRGNIRAPDRAPVVKAVVLNGSRVEVLEVPARVGPAGKGIAGGMIHPVTAALSLTGLAAGQYELEIRVDGQSRVTRRVNFGLR